MGIKVLLPLLVHHIPLLGVEEVEVLVQHQVIMVVLEAAAVIHLLHLVEDQQFLDKDL
jgi:hypothetical protein